MKKYFILLFAFVSLTVNTIYAQAELWESISNRIPGDSLTQNLSDVLSLSPYDSWITSNSFPEIYQSSDFCQTWEKKSVPAPIDFYRFNESTYEGYIFCSDGSIFKTKDLGDSWDSVTTTNSSINGVAIIYHNSDWKGYLCGDSGKVWIFDENGISEVNSGLTTNIKSISARINDNVWLCDETTIFFYDGTTFTPKFTASKKLNSIEFKYNSYIWAVGDSGYIAFSSDSGQNWTEQNNPDAQNRILNDIYFNPFWGWGNGWAVGNNGIILKTTNYGNTWLIDGEGITNKNLNVVNFNASQDGFGGNFGPGLIIGDNKTVLFRPIIVSAEDEQKTVYNFYLYQNYPNPFNSITKIGFQINEPGFVTLKVFGVLGNEVTTLVNKEKPAGIYEVEFDATVLPSGIYFYQLKASAFIQTMKMILLK